MKRTILFGLYSVIFVLISASVCFAQDWTVTEVDEFEYEDTDLSSDRYFDDIYDDVDDPEIVVVEPAAEPPSAAPANAAPANVAPQPRPQPSVKIVIPMITNPPAKPAQPAQPAPPPPPVQHAPPAQPVPPVQTAPPVIMQPTLPIKVIPAMPNPNGNGVYRVQVGAFGNTGLAQQCFSRLRAAGFSPSYEPYGNVNRVVLAGINAADMAAVVQRLAAAGFNEVWIREEN